MSSDGVAVAPERAGATRRPRQEETVRKLVCAALETLRESSYADLTVRAVAARAQVAPATAYTYFSSKNHLVAEVYLDLVRQVPFFTDVNDTRISRVQQALRSLALVVADEPEVAAACTTALLSTDAAVRAGCRDRPPARGRCSRGCAAADARALRRRRTGRSDGLSFFLLLTRHLQSGKIFFFSY